MTETESHLQAYEDGVISIFADLAELFGNPRSYGHPLRSALCQRSAPESRHHTLPFRHEPGFQQHGSSCPRVFGAIVRERPSGSRTAIYRAKLEMKLLIAGFLKERVLPRLESTEQRVQALQKSISSLPNGDSITPSQHLERLAQWHRSARTLLPLASKILGG